MQVPCTEEDEKYFSEEEIQLREDVIKDREQDQEYYKGLNYLDAKKFRKEKMDEAIEFAKRKEKIKIDKNELTHQQGEICLNLVESRVREAINRAFPKVELQNTECYFSSEHIYFLIQKILDGNNALVAFNLLEHDSDFIKFVTLHSEKTCKDFISIAKLRDHTNKTIVAITRFIKPAGKLKKFHASKYFEESENNIMMSKEHYDKQELAIKKEHSKNVLEEKKVHSNKRSRITKDNKKLRHSCMSLLLDYKLLRDTQEDIKFYSSGRLSTCLIKLTNLVKLANQLNSDALEIKKLKNELKAAFRNSTSKLDSANNWTPKIWHDIALKRKFTDGISIPNIKEELDIMCDMYKVHEVDRPSKRAIEQYCSRNKAKYIASK